MEEIRLSLISESTVKVRTYPIISDGQISIGGHDYQYMCIKRMITNQDKLSLNNREPELFIETNLYNQKQYCIGYLNKSITIILNTEADREKLLLYLQKKRSDSFLLFVSGYDFMDEVKEFLNKNENKEEYETWIDKTVGFVRKTPVAYDSKEYWGSDFIDGMVSRLLPKKVTFMSGHDNIGTSNHRIIDAFILSMISSYRARYYFLSTCFQNWACVILMTPPNVEGFNQRRENGRRRGVDYVNILKSECLQDANGMARDTVDVVCHSMGFATALGIVDAIKESMKTDLKGLTLGRFYIIAPENASSGEISVNDWREMWHYGSDEIKLRPKPWLQDGVAPQSSIKNFPPKRRVAIPDQESHGFLESHKITNYNWIFTRNNTQDGYITPRK